MNDLVTTIDDREAVTSSRVVATAFEKRHDNVLRDIRGLLKIEDTQGMFYKNNTKKSKKYVKETA